MTMKTTKHIVLFCASMLALAGCGATNQLTMGAVEPARIHIPSGVVKVGIIDRSVPSEGNKTLDKIDKVLSLEGLHLDREGAQAAVVGLYDELERIGRYETIDIIESGPLERKGLGVFPAALSWKDVEALCDAHGVEVLFSLEFYDTDTKVDYRADMITVPNDLGVKVSLPGHKVTLHTAIKNGWRVYDPHSKMILDEYITHDHVTSRGEGINPMKAIEAIVGRKEAVLQSSTYIGNRYGLDTRPKRKRISRQYFVRGTDNFEVAQRRAQTGDWQGAASLWEMEVAHPNSKVAGRACYNMAIINEINGDLDKAMEWASKSYTDYENSHALTYLNVLKRRVAEKTRLNDQLSR